MKKQDAEFIYEEIKARIEEDYPKEEIINIISMWKFEGRTMKCPKCIKKYGLTQINCRHKYKDLIEVEK